MARRGSISARGSKRGRSPDSIVESASNQQGSANTVFLVGNKVVEKSF